MQAGDLGDHLGMESCVDLETDTQSALYSGNIGTGGIGTVNRKPWGILSNRRSVEKRGKQLPPTLPIQTSTVMRRYYTDDGRLVIREEKVKSPRYRFMAHRSDGRLRLEVVASDRLSCDGSGVEEDGDMEDERCSGSKVAVGGGDDGDGVGERFSCNAAVRVGATRPCLFVAHDQLHTVRPVHI